MFATRGNGRLWRAALAMLSMWMGTMSASAVPAAAQTATPTAEERLQDLERQLTELRAELAALRAERAAAAPAPTPAAEPAPAPSAAPSPSPTETDRLAELERRLEVLAGELERIELGEVAAVADEGERGLGPA